MAGRKPSDPTAEIKGVLKWHVVTQGMIALEVGESEETMSRKLAAGDVFAAFLYGAAFKEIIARKAQRGQQPR